MPAIGLPDGDRVEFGGERMRMSTDAHGVTTYIFDDVGTGRSCGTCTLCCKLVPVPPLRKPAGVRCQHQRHGKGCAIYADRPTACRTWGCRWLVDPAAAALPRPDRAHYVVDMEEDTVTLQPKDGGPPTKVPVIQVWIDPAFPDACRTPAFRSYMLAMAEKHRVATIIRWSSTRATTIFPPPLNSDGAWHEITDGQVVARTPEERQVMLGFSE